MVATRLQTALSLVYPARCLGCGTMVNDDFGLCGTCWRDTPPPWDQGRAALAYRDRARSLVLGLKHADRQEVVVPASGWMARAVRDIVVPEMLVAPVPLHWTRMLSRRTRSLDKLDGAQRRVILDGALRLNPARAHRVSAGRPVLLVDDVMTSGATMAEATRAVRASGAGRVCAVTLARVTKAT